MPCRHVLYTPLEATFDNCASDLSGRAIAFTGTADPWVESTAAITDRCQKAGIPVHVIEKANHSLETADVWKNLKNLEKIMALTADFISREKSLDFEQTPSAIVRKNQMKDGGADDDQGSK